RQSHPQSELADVARADHRRTPDGHPWNGACARDLELSPLGDVQNRSSGRAMKAGFVEKLIGSLGKIGSEEVQNYFLRLAQEKGFLETVFNAIHEGIIVTDSNGRVTYLKDAASKLFGWKATDDIGKRIDDRVRGLARRALI